MSIRTKRREPWMLGDAITQNIRDQAPLRELEME